MYTVVVWIMVKNLQQSSYSVKLIILEMAYERNLWIEENHFKIGVMSLL